MYLRKFIQFASYFQIYDKFSNCQSLSQEATVSRRRKSYKNVDYFLITEANWRKFA